MFANFLGLVKGSVYNPSFVCSIVRMHEDDLSEPLDYINWRIAVCVSHLHVRTWKAQLISSEHTFADWSS
jgi:hypothetical protein